MMVENWMTRDVISLDVNDPLTRAADLLERHGVRLLPVHRFGKLVGIVTSADLKRAVGEDPTHLPAVSVGDVMSKNPVTIPPDYTIQEAAEILVDRAVPGCPVLDRDGRTVGIVTKTDILKALVASPGIAQIGMVFGLRAREHESCVEEILNVIKEYRAQLLTVWSSYANAPEGFRNIYVRIVHRDPAVLSRLEEDLKKSCEILFLIDRRQGRREIYEGARTCARGA